ncbi:MAG TPA: hypothetical protein PLD87_10100 [Bacteroidia bacterium]|nr:hypothetical protein [Bacteroidia bacterium]
MEYLQTIDYIILGFTFIVFLFGAILLIPQTIDKYKKCPKCKSRFNKQYITGQYGTGWNECRCEWKK